MVTCPVQLLFAQVARIDMDVVEVEPWRATRVDLPGLQTGEVQPAAGYVELEVLVL
jgi:hypothetical protein